MKNIQKNVENRTLKALKLPRSVILIDKTKVSLPEWISRTEKNHTAWCNYVNDLIMLKDRETKRKYQKFEYYPNFLSIHVNPDDREHISLCLHPQERNRVLPTADANIPKGHYWIDELTMYIHQPLIGPGIDYQAVMQEEEKWDLAYRTTR